MRTGILTGFGKLQVNRLVSIMDYGIKRAERVIIDTAKQFPRLVTSTARK